MVHTLNPKVPQESCANVWQVNFLILQKYILIGFINGITRSLDKAQNNNTSIFHLGKPIGRKPSNLRLEIIILRSQYNEERGKERSIFQRQKPQKQSSPSIGANFSLPKTMNFTCAAIRYNEEGRLLFILIFHQENHLG